MSRIRNKLEQVRQCPDYRPLNQTHHLVVTLQSDKGKLIRFESFQLLKTPDMLNYITPSGAVLNNQSAFIKIDPPNHLSCIYFEQGVLAFSETVSVTVSIFEQRTVTASESQAIALRHFEKLNQGL